MKKSDISRRDFMKSSLAASAALAVPTILPGSAWGEDAPSKRVNVALLGCGNIGNYHKNWLVQYPDARVVAVCDAYKSRRTDRKAHV